VTGRRRPHLAVVPDNAHEAAASPSTVARRAGAPVTDWQRMQIEGARKVLMDAPGLFATRPDAYVAGLIEGAASVLLDVLDSITEV
jgi:hypothetical protein